MLKRTPIKEYLDIMNHERDQILEQFLKEHPQVKYLMVHYPLQAKYLWKMYLFDKKLDFSI